MKRSVFSLAILASLCGPVRASEGGVSFYIPGVKGPMAGFLPPPGVFFQDDAYF
jgi:hypothetical protein